MKMLIFGHSSLGTHRVSIGFSDPLSQKGQLVRNLLTLPKVANSVAQTPRRQTVW